MCVKPPRKATLTRLAGMVLGIAALGLQTVALGAMSGEEQRVFSLFKTTPGQQRAQNAIQGDPILSSVARAKAKDMADRDYFGHITPDGLGPNALVARAGYKLPAWWGSDPKANYIESIAAGFTSADIVWQGWMDSPTHKRHLLAEDEFYRNQTAVGVGYYYSASSTYKHYWVIFTAPPSGPAVKIKTPRRLARISMPEVNVAGTASAEPSTVEYSVINASGTSAFQTALGTKEWSAQVTGLEAGRNIIVVRSVNASGEVMAKASVVVKHVVRSPLTVTVEGQGSVSAGFEGTTYRRVGKKFVINAKPAAGWRFVGWTGSVESPNKRLKTRMVEDMQLTAVFEPVPTE